MSKLVIFGAANMGRLARFYFMNDSQHEVVAFTATADYVATTEFEGLPLIPFDEVERLYPPRDYKMFVAVGYTKMNRVRMGMYEAAKAKGYELVTYVSSKCTNWAAEGIGDNCFIFEDNTIQPFVTIGNNVVLWSGNHIGHHASIGDHCFISSHVVISGFSQIGARSFLGVNATIRDGIAIGEGCLIGAGSIIMKSSAAGEVYLPKRTERVLLRSDDLDI